MISFSLSSYTNMLLIRHPSTGSQASPRLCRAIEGCLEKINTQVSRDRHTIRRRLRTNVIAKTPNTLPGFSLIELLVATAIAAGLSLALFQAFNQMNHATQSIDGMVDIYTRAIITTHQMERDIAGAFVPLQLQEEYTAENKKGESSAPNKPTQNAKPEDDKKKLTHLFYSVNKDNNLQTLTFITNNPLQMYWSSSAGSAKPRIARVVYRVKPQTPPKGWRQPSYVLTRQESPQLDFERFNPDATPSIKEFELIKGIKSLTCTYWSAPEKSSEEKNDTSSKGDNNQTEDKRSEYTKVNEWDKDQKALLPHFVEITLTLWNNQQRSDKTFTFTIPIYPDIHYKSSFADTTSAVSTPTTVGPSLAVPNPLMELAALPALTLQQTTTLVQATLPEQQEQP